MSVNVEIQLINQLLDSGDPNYLARLNVTPSHFTMYRGMVVWIKGFVGQYGTLPTKETVFNEFEDFKILESTDSTDYLIKEVTNARVLTTLRPVIMESAEQLNAENVKEAIQILRSGVEEAQKSFSHTVPRYDWVKDAPSRFEEYMKKHGQTGLAGVSTGVPELDEHTGGWVGDDFILISARLNEGKSLVGNYFGFHAWRSALQTDCDRPILHVSTEMPSVEVAYRLDTLKAHFSNTALTKGQLQDPSLYEGYLSELATKENSYIIMTEQDNDNQPFTVGDIEALVAEYKPRLLIVDQLYDLEDGTGEREIRKKIVNCTRELRRINLSTGTPTIVIAQAGRESAKMARKDPHATPELDQIQESDAPAQKATKAITIKMLAPTLIKLTLKKNRGGKKNLDLYMRVDIDTGFWTPITENEVVF